MADGFDFGTSPRTFGEHLTRAGQTRTERILSDGNAHEVQQLIDEGNRSSFTKGAAVATAIGALALALRR